MERLGDKPALQWMNAKSDTEFTGWSWRQYREQVQSFARSLVKVGMAPFQSVNIMGFNSRHWLVANVGAIAAGGMAAGVYTTSAPKAVAYQMKHSEAAVAVVDGVAQLGKFKPIVGDLPQLKALVVYNCTEVPSDLKAALEAGGKVKVYTWDAFMGLGSEAQDGEVASRIAAAKPGNCCTLIYTSGTTGIPKAVMISNDNATWTAQQLAESIESSPSDRGVSYLPLSHVAAQILDIHVPMCMLLLLLLLLHTLSISLYLALLPPSLASVTGSVVYFAFPDALKGTLGLTLKAAQPTVFFGVPRVWEKFMAALSAVQAPPAAKRGAVGLGKCRVAYTGAAPTSPEVFTFFDSIGLPLFEVFGQSECTGPQCVNLPAIGDKPERRKVGTCGPALPGTEMRIVAETKEVVYRGRHIMMGYMKSPEKTREAIDSEGECWVQCTCVCDCVTVWLGVD